MRKQIPRRALWILLAVVVLGTGTARELWHRLTDQSFRTLSGHQHVVWSVCFSPDGQRLASSGGYSLRGAGQIRIWDTASGRLLHTLWGHHGTVWSVAFSADGRYLASASQDQTVKVWEAATRQVTHTLPHAAAVRSVAFSPDGHLLASRAGNQIRLWNAATGRAQRTLEVGAAGVREEQSRFYGPGGSLAWSPNGTRLATGAGDDVTVWDVKSGRRRLTLKGHRSNINSVAFSSDSAQLASASGFESEPGEVKVWDAATGQELLALKGPLPAITSVAWSPDGRWLATASGGYEPGGLAAAPELQIWNARTGARIIALKGHRDYIQSVAFSRDGRRLGTASSDKTAKLWNPELDSAGRAGDAKL